MAAPRRECCGVEQGMWHAPGCPLMTPVKAPTNFENMDAGEIAKSLVEDIFGTPFTDRRIRIEMPLSLPSDCQYAIVAPQPRQEDKIVRILIEGKTAVEIHPDGSLHGTNKGWAIPAVPLEEAGDAQGMRYVNLCPKCGQPLPAGERCNSGIHQGPDDVGTEGTERDTRPLAVRSIDLVDAQKTSSSFTDEELRFIYNVIEHTQAPAGKSIKQKLKPRFGRSR